MLPLHQPRPPRQNIQTLPLSPAHGTQVQSLGFSPLLTSLLSYTIRDGLVNKTAFNLLHDIYPYVCETDRARIEQLLACRNLAGELAQTASLPVLPSTLQLKRTLSQQEKLIGLLRVLRRYGGQRQNSGFDMMERMMAMRSRINAASWKPGSMENMFELMELLGMTHGTGEIKKMAGLMQMMQQGGGDFSNLANLAGMFSK